MNTYSKRAAGSILPLVAVSMTLLLLMLAMAVDLGWVVLAKNQLQNAADAAALAGASQLVDEDFLFGFTDPTDDIEESRDYAETFAGYNTAARRYLLLDRNEANDPNGGIVVGYIEDPLDLNSQLQTQGVSEYNSVRVAAKLGETTNGPLQLFFGALTGVDTLEMGAAATASIDDRVVGFALKGNETLDMLPFTVSVDVWDEGFPGDPIGASLWPLMGLEFLKLLACHPSSHWQNGILNIYPTALGEGNFGTIDIGPPNNSTSDLVRQIQDGVSQADLDAIGGFELTDEDADGVFSKWLNGDTGVSAGIKSALESIIGQPRILPLFRNYSGPGNNRMYEIVRFAGVKIVSVKLTGYDKYINVEPYQITTRQALIHANAPGSNLVYGISLTR